MLWNLKMYTLVPEIELENSAIGSPHASCIKYAKPVRTFSLTSNDKEVFLQVKRTLLFTVCGFFFSLPDEIYLFTCLFTSYLHICQLFLFSHSCIIVIIRCSPTDFSFDD